MDTLILQRSTSVWALVGKTRASDASSISLLPTWYRSFASLTKKGSSRNCNCLLGISGIGQTNLSKLIDSGIETMDDLKLMYKKNFLRKPSYKMVEFLQKEVGIRHSNHAKSITFFVKEAVEEDLAKNNPHCNKYKKDYQQKKLTFCVEGNTGVGITSFLEGLANQTPMMRDLVEVIPEPTSKWNNVGSHHHSLLDAFHAWPQRYAYTLANYVFITRVAQEMESAKGIKPIRLMERSVFSDRMVSVRAFHDMKWMHDMEMSIYNSWFDPLVSCFPGLVPDGLIYLRASPATCYKRMMITASEKQEDILTLDFFKSSHEKLESLLYPSSNRNCGVLPVTCLPLETNDSSMNPEIRDRVFYLKANHLYSSVEKQQQVPVLILDYESRIDFTRDTYTKKEYIRQVEEFLKFVKTKRDQRT